MKLIVDIPKELKSAVYRCGLFLNPTDKTSLIDAINNGTHIPDNATNSDVMLTMFPNETDLHNFARHNKVVWWNALY